MSLGSYNLAGGLVLLLIGALLLVGQQLGSAAGRRLITLIAAGLALVAAASLHIQLVVSTPVLGGSATSAAFLPCLGAVAFAVAPRTTRVADAPAASMPP